MFEKVNTVKVTSVEVSRVTIGQPVVATPEITYTPATTRTTSASTTTTVTTTTSYPPRIKNIDPDKGKTGTTVTLNSLDGEDFVNGATLSLTKAGTTINATDVVFVSSIQLKGKFVIPADATTGYWDILVTNPDKQRHLYQNGFNILQGEASPSTTTTSSGSSAKVTITQIQDTLLVTGGAASYKEVNILGTNLTAGANMQLTGPSTITSTAFTSGSTTAKGFFNIPYGAVGSFYVTVVDSSGKVLATSPNTLTIQ
jgi:hypothetical protein